MKAPVSKTGIPLWGIAGSNPALSASKSTMGELSRKSATAVDPTAIGPAMSADFSLILRNGTETNLIPPPQIAGHTRTL